MLDLILPLLCGACFGVAVTLILTRRLSLSEEAIRQILNVLTTLYEHLADDGYLDDVEKAELRDQVRQLIAQLKNTLKETT